MTTMRINSLVDIHTHVIPGIDDGPPTLDGSVAMVRAAESAGITVMAATPHLRSDFPNVRVEEITERVQEVRNATEAEGLSVSLVGAAEISLIWALEADDDELRLASFGGVGKHLLVETPASTTYGLEGLLSDVQRRGYRIILAHPERSPDFQKEPGRLAELADRGIVLQVNAESLLGRPGNSRVRNLARKLCADGTAGILASDGHRGDGWRPVTSLSFAAEALAALVGIERASWMTARAPGSILAGEDPPPPPPLLVRKRRIKFPGFAK